MYLVRGNHEFRDMSENMGELGFLSLSQMLNFRLPVVLNPMNLRFHCQSRMKKRWRSVPVLANGMSWHISIDDFLWSLPHRLGWEERLVKDHVTC